MYQFSISFKSLSPDDEEIKAFFHARSDVTDLSIRCVEKVPAKGPKRRDRRKGSAQNPSEPAARPARGHAKGTVFSQLEDGAVRSVRDICDALPQIPYTLVASLLDELAMDGSLKKISRGLYQIATAEDLDPRKIAGLARLRKHKMKRPGSRDEELLEFLKIPRRPREVQEFLQISRQGTDQQLKSLQARRLIFRGSHDGSAVIYCADQALLVEAVADRATGFSPPARAVLECLPDAPIFHEDILANVTVSSVSVRRGLRELEAAGLVQTMHVVKRLLVSMTDVGLSASGRGEPEKRAAGSDLCAIVGHPRSEILHLLKVMGPMPTRTITLALAGVYPDVAWPLSPGQIIERLVREGLIDARSVAGSSQADRGLSEHGEKLVAMLMPHLPQISRDQVSAAIERVRLEKLRNRKPRR